MGSTTDLGLGITIHGNNSYLFDGQKSTFFPRGKTRVVLSPEAAGRRNKYKHVFNILWIGNVANFQYQVKFVKFEDRGRM